MTTALLLASLSAFAARGRVTVVQNGAWDYLSGTYDEELPGRTVVTDQGTLLRSTNFWCMTFHSWAVRYAINKASWQRIVESGFNCARISVHNYDPDKYGDPIRYTEEEWLEQIDEWVDWAEELGIYIIIDHHEVGTHNQGWLLNFWDQVAPRYRHRTHVIYEMANEPVGWQVSDYTAQDIADQQEVYDLIRSHAPRTHVVVLSFAVPGSGMNAVAEQLQVDWSITSVGFHGYWMSNASPINELKQQFPVINTEFSSPETSFAGSNPPYYLDGHAWQSELMEKFRISWNVWDANYKSSSYSAVMTPLLQQATDNQYLWEPDDYSRDWADSVSTGGWQWRGRESWAYSPEEGWLHRMPADEGVQLYHLGADTWIQPGS